MTAALLCAALTAVLSLSCSGSARAQPEVNPSDRAPASCDHAVCSAFSNRGAQCKRSTPCQWDKSAKLCSCPAEPTPTPMPTPTPSGCDPDFCSAISKGGQCKRNSPPCEWDRVGRTCSCTGDTPTPTPTPPSPTPTPTPSPPDCEQSFCDTFDKGGRCNMNPPCNWNARSKQCLCPAEPTPTPPSPTPSLPPPPPGCDKWSCSQYDGRRGKCLNGRFGGQFGCRYDLKTTSCSCPWSWTQLGDDLDGEAAGDRSGKSVSCSADGTRVAVGAAGNDGNGINAGHVRVFEFSEENGWEQMGADIDGEAAGDYSGYSVSISADGSRVLIGAYGNDGHGNRAGHARVFQYSRENGWEQVGADIDGEAANDWSGYSVSISADGSSVAVGAYGNDGTGHRAGHVRVFQYSHENDWEQVGADIDGEARYDHSGYSVSLSANGTRVAVGANGNDDNGQSAGHVRVFQLSPENGWEQLGADIDGEATWDGSGKSVSLSANGTRVAVGAPWNDANGNETGHVRVFQLSPVTGWEQVGTDIDGEAAGDFSGKSLSLSADGARVAVGAYRNGNDYHAGHVRVFDLSPENVWEQVGADIDGEAANDWSGWSVSLSADGTRVAIGAYQNDGNGTEAGHVRVFEYGL